jgi:hypothetical protein
MAARTAGAADAMGQPMQVDVRREPWQTTLVPQSERRLKLPRPKASQPSGQRSMPQRTVLVRRRDEGQ